MRFRSFSRRLVIASVLSVASCGGKALSTGGDDSGTEDGGKPSGACSGAAPSCGTLCGEIVAPECVKDGWACPPIPFTRCPGSRDASVAAEDAAPPTGDDGGLLPVGPTPPAELACGNGECPPGMFCREEGDVTGANGQSPWLCLSYPAACTADTSCECVIGQNAYDCPAPLGWSCEDTDAGPIVGCDAP